MDVRGNSVRAVVFLLISLWMDGHFGHFGARFCGDGAFFSDFFLAKSIFLPKFAAELCPLAFSSR